MSVAGPCRVVAWAIAIAGVIDPVVAVTRAPRPRVAIVDADGPHMALPVASDDPRSRRDAARAATDRLAKELSGFADVSRGPRLDADAWIVVGAGQAPGRVPPQDMRVWTLDLASPLSPNVALTSVTPAAGRLGSRTRIPITIEGNGVTGRTSTITLRAGGLDVAEARHLWLPDQDHATVVLEVVPWRAPLLMLEASVRTDDREVTTVDNHGTVPVRVEEEPWRVLVYEPRPSWNVAFARRALEGDARFAIGSRTVLARGIAATTGQTPSAAGLTADSLSLVDVVLVGAPERLGAGDRRRLADFVTRRGGALIVALDQVPPSPGAMFDTALAERLIERPTAVQLTAMPETSWHASELALAMRLPAGAEVLATAGIAGAPPVVVRERHGDGQMVLFGALDAWRHRDAAQSTFDVAWRTLVAMAAAETAPMLDATLATHVARPGDSVPLEVRVRRTEWLDADGTRLPPVSVVLENEQVRRHVPLVPGAEPGVLVGRVVAPDDVGRWRVVATSHGVRPAEAARPLEVRADAPGWPTASVPLSVLGRGRGGRAASGSDIDRVIASLRGAMPQEPARIQQMHVMRSRWWGVAFVLAAGSEWWIRRRRGQR